jgi:hypothetical protein
MSEIKTNKISPRKGTTQTIGDSGDTLSIACGATLSNAGTISTVGITGGTINNSGGTISGLVGVINWDTTAKTSGFTAVSNTGYFCNTTSTTFTVTLPASPSAGDVIGFKDYANTFDTNKLSIDPNGNNIQGSASNFDITVEGTAAQFIYVDATRGWVLTDASKASDIAEGPSFITATGGCISYCGDYKIHTFNSPGTFCVSQIGNAPTVPTGGPSNVDYLVIAGGGGGGARYAGGAGAGGYRTSYPTACGALTITTTAYPITVGAGGAGNTNCGSNGPGSNGNPSIFSTITSAGGGYGIGAQDTTGPQGSGGSGGGASYRGTGGTGNTPPVSPSQGNPGGPHSPPDGFAGGGGGGASGTGGTSSCATAGNGGNGTANSITGSSVTRAGGGGGGNFPGSGAGSGGTGGGGAGSTGSTALATAGTANTGGGGGGGGGKGASGGSGVVIIRYKYQ